MRKIFVFISILILILLTSLVKNSTKKIDEKIYSTKENIFFLKKLFEESKLENDYLSSSEKLLDFQKSFFENSLQKKRLEEIKVVLISEEKLIIKNLSIVGKNER
tara:strand:- start:346 stop:660 length:315 start_codon:yes stop_codon:yes gene_type:complete